MKNSRAGKFKWEGQLISLLPIGPNTSQSAFSAILLQILLSLYKFLPLEKSQTFLNSLSWVQQLISSNKLHGKNYNIKQDINTSVIIEVPIKKLDFS